MAVAKVVVLGAQGSGRSSLVSALATSGSSPESPPSPSSTKELFDVAISSTVLENGNDAIRVELSDFVGSTLLDAAFALFLSPKALFVVAVDLAAYAAKYQSTLDVRDRNAGSVLDEHVQTHTSWSRLR
ncbi:hypothetical protein ATCC90586_010326 [Pythium insidiosum]|nr:hypothetical protein ATCC90586_010326 [Pythium insidiosum]